MMEECKGSMNEFRKFVRAEKKKAFSRAATWEGGVKSVNPAEEPTVKKPPRGEVSAESWDKAEEKKDKSQLPAPQTGKAGARFKAYYNKLSNTGPGGEDVVKALKVNSELKAENKKLIAELTEAQDELEKVKTELEAIKTKETVRADSEIIASIIESVADGKDIGEEKTKELINTLAQIDNDNLKKVKAFFSKTRAKELNEIEIENEDGNLPVVTASKEDGVDDPAQKLSDAMVANSKKRR